MVEIAEFAQTKLERQSGRKRMEKEEDRTSKQISFGALIVLILVRSNFLVMRICELISH